MESSITFDFPSAQFDLVEIANHTFVESIDFRRECESTNSLALENADTQTWPRLFLTDCQTAGRGRGSNQWWAREGSLTVSVVCQPECWNVSRTDWPRVSLATATAVRDTLVAIEASLKSETAKSSRFSNYRLDELTRATTGQRLVNGTTEPANGFEVGLKWPNDVHLNRRKVCGILVEPSRSTDGLVIGVGVNVNNSVREAPMEIRGLATSILDETGIEFGMTSFLVELLSHLETRLRQLGEKKLALPEIWAAHCVLTGKRITLQAADQQVTGRCKGIDDSGAIRIESNGETKSWFGGVVRFVD